MELNSYPKQNRGLNNLVSWSASRIGLFFTFFLFTFLSGNTNAQVTILPECINNVPLLYVDLSAAPDSTYISPLLNRTGECCGGTGTSRFISFYATLHPNAAMVEIGVAEGADPYGAGAYHFIDGGDLFTPGSCIPEIPAGSPVCIPPGITGPDYKIAFSKPGNNKNKFFFRQILKPTFPQDDSTRVGCSLPFDIYGLTNTTIEAIATSDASTPSNYNGLIDMSDPVHPIFSPGAGTPQWIDYRICGDQEASTTCGIYETCDTVRFYTFPRLTVNVTPNPASFCSGGSVDITANSSGGFGTHTYSWTDGALTEVSTNVTLSVSNEDIYEVAVSDDLISPTCPTATYSIPVTEGLIPSANAGSNIKVCADSPTTTLVGSVTNSSGGSWTGGDGTFSPSANDLIVNYTPTAAEINTGFVILTLTTTGSAESCSSASDNVTIYFSDTLYANPSYTALQCNGDSATISSNVTGGTSPITYLWSTGSTASSILAPAGTYSVTVTDSVGCNVTESITVIEPNPIVLTTLSVDESVDLACDGDVSVSVSGGSGPYLYDWDNDGTGDFDDPESITNSLCYGIYTVTVQDALGCQSTISTVVNSATCSSLEVSATNSDVNCYGDATASATASATGGSGGYTYSWNTDPVQNAATATNLSAGTYTVTVTDGVGCIDVTNVTVIQPPIITNTMTWTDATSIGGTEGTATANPLGGNPTYSYSWSPAPASPQITQTVTGLSEGTYYVDITDQNSCVRQDSVHINQPPCNDFYIYVNPSDISCYGLADGAANLIISNGTAPFSISWSSGEVDVTNVSGLSAGNYSVTVTDNSSCTTFATFDIVEPSPLSISLLPNNISCYGANDGTVDLTVTGGIFPYEFDWTQGDANISDNEDIINLNTGTYSVSVQDANGCTIEGSASITQPQPLITSPIPSPISCFGANDGSATVNTTGGTPIYSYSWAGPLGYTGSGNSIASLAPGQYFVTTTDASGCSHVIDTYIDEPEQLNTVATVLDSVSCLGSSDGNIDLAVTGGTEPYGYNWTGPSAFTSIDEDISGLIDGTYNFTVTDNNSCTTNGSIILGTTVDITNPVISCGSTGENVDSDPGNCTYSVIGSSWDASATDNCLVSSVEFVLTGATSGTGTTLDGIVFNQGTTTVTWTATDNSGNIDVCSYDITVVDNELPAFTSCIGSDQTVSSDAGVCSFTQIGNLWDANATDNCTVSTITYTLSGATTGSGSTLDGITFNLGTTNVTWTVLDGSGNTQTCVFNVIVEDNELPSFTSCLGSNQNVNVDAGTCDYTHAGTNWDAVVTDNCSISSFNYNLTGATIGNGTSLDGVVFNLGTTTVTWSATDDSGNSSTCIYDIIVTDSELPQISCVGNIESCDPIVTFPVAIASDNCGLAGIAQTTGLTSGSSFNIGTTTITYEAIDASGNANTCSFDIIIHPIPTLNLTSTDISCNGLTDGSIDLEVSTSTAPYVFTWSNGETTEDIAGLSEGNYSVSVEDVYGCTNSASSSIVEPEQLSLTKIVNHVSCYSADDGAIDIEVSGGITPYSYSWSNSAISEDVNLLAPGVYTVDVTDVNGCLLSNATNIVQPDSIEFQHLVTDATCNAPNGTINVQATGGTTPYNYLWSNGLNTQNLTNAVSGTYTLTLTDNNGCLAALTDSVGTTSNISAIVYPYNVSCYGESDGSALAVVQTGNAPYYYDWSNGDQTDLANGMAAGTYSVTITDAFGCEVDLSFDITQPDSLYVELTSNEVIPGFQVSPNGNDNGSIYTSVYGGTPEYEYSWAMGSTDADLFNLAAGTYYLTVTDENRCKAFAEITLQEPNDLDIPEGVSPNGDQENDYFVVRGLESYPDNHITIYNRWGNIVYQQEGYQNDWEGNNNRGEALPDGTYYVVLSVNKGDERKTLTGYIDLRRTR